MRTLIALLALAVLAVVTTLACEHLVGVVARDAEVAATREKVVRQAHAGLRAVRERNPGLDEADWPEVDREIYRNNLEALRREGELP